MSVDQTGVIDFIGVEARSNTVVHTIADQLDWEDADIHQELLQEKLNTYLAFVESGELFEHYSVPDDAVIRVEVVFKYPPDSRLIHFLALARKTLQSAGLTLTNRNFTGSETQ